MTNDTRLPATTLRNFRLERIRTQNLSLRDAQLQGSTDGEAPPLADPPDADEEVPDKPDRTSPVTHVDRTVGEVQPDEVTRKHEFDPGSHPGH